MIVILFNIFISLSEATQTRPTIPGIAAGVCPTSISPLPTAAPAFPNIQHDLLKRQNLATCAYQDGEPVTCVSAGYACATNAYYSAAGCCDAGIFSDCALPTTCVSNFDLGECEPDCQSDYLALSCTDAIYPSCATFLFVNGGTYTGFGCAVLGAVYTATPVYQIPITNFDAGLTTAKAASYTAAMTVSVTATITDGSNDNDGNGNTAGGSGAVQNNGGGSINIYTNDVSRQVGGRRHVSLVVLCSYWIAWSVFDWVFEPVTML